MARRLRSAPTGKVSRKMVVAAVRVINSASLSFESTNVKLTTSDENVGDGVGCFVGELLGAPDGCELGAVLGAELRLGLVEGTPLGAKLGTSLGLILGEELGLLLGL